MLNGLTAWLPCDRPLLCFVNLLGLPVRNRATALWSVLPETAIVPTFSYSYSRGEAYERISSPCRAGAFGAYVMSQPGVVRSVDPIFSVATRLTLPAPLTTIGDVSCFGRDSVWQWALRNDGYAIFLGTTLDSCTFLHHAEWLMQVSYRYEKQFPGNTEGIPTTATYYCRRMELGLSTSTVRLQQRVILHSQSFGAWPVSVIRLSTLLDAVTSLIDEDAYGLVA